VQLDDATHIVRVTLHADLEATQQAHKVTRRRDERRARCAQTKVAQFTCQCVAGHAATVVLLET
jgi:hypothetical protein